jgi:hypothetical protein
MELDFNEKHVVLSRSVIEQNKLLEDVAKKALWLIFEIHLLEIE